MQPARGKRRIRRRDDRGETLVELVVAVAILGIAAVAILAGMMLNAKASAVHRNEAGGGAYVRSAAEAVQKKIDNDSAYASCASAVSTYAAAANAVSDLPSGYSATVLKVQSWKGNATGWSACDDSNGIQRIQLQVTTPGDSTHQAVETLYVVLRKPCSKPGDDPCA